MTRSTIETAGFQLDSVDVWLSEFASAVQRCDVRAAADLFVSEGNWRDLLAFTWSLRTFSGRENIAAGLEQVFGGPKLVRVSASTTVAPQMVRRAGQDCLEALFELETTEGCGTGVLRLLVETGSTAPKAWTLLTALGQLNGHEEHVGERRPSGLSYSRGFGGENWLDQRRAAQSYVDREPDVLIIGGGQAGLGVAARLRQLDVDALIVDRLDRVGDNWRNRYHSLSLHNEVDVAHLPYMPFPPTWPRYVPKDMLANWFEFYVEALELNYWTGTEFLGARYVESDARWEVVVRRPDGSERALRPAHLVMATGVSGIPSIPEIPGLRDFRGEVLHSSRFVSGAKYAGKSVVVIGAGNSGHDVAQELCTSGSAVTLVQRSPTTVASLEPSAQKVYSVYSEGLPTEVADLLAASVSYPMLVKSYQLLSAEMQDTDRELLDGLHAAGFRTDYGEDGTGLQMKYLRRGGGYYINVGCSELLIDGHISLIQNSDISAVTEDGLLLTDGRTHCADAIMLATGYKNLQESLRMFFGDAVANSVGPIWDFDEEGELRNMWRRTAQPGLWFAAGSLAQCRIYSHFLALQIKHAGLGDRQEV
jgi:cation diffusion facilitator CzcD-associated flavoprotein CzcO